MAKRSLVGGFYYEGQRTRRQMLMFTKKVKAFFFFERVFFPLKQNWMWTKFTRMCLICAVWRISIIRLKYKDNNNRKQRNCGRRRWRWQEVASYLRRQPILWQISSVRATNRRPSCLKIKPMTTTSTLCLRTDFTEWGEIPDGWNNLNVCNEGNIFLWPVFQVFHVASFPHHCSWTCSIWRLLMVSPVPLQPKPAKMDWLVFVGLLKEEKSLKVSGNDFQQMSYKSGQRQGLFFSRLNVWQPAQCLETSSMG